MKKRRLIPATIIAALAGYIGIATRLVPAGLDQRLHRSYRCANAQGMDHGAEWHAHQDRALT
jgi:hypothetical protein